jgi:predicted lipoprotein with Yx(FWY)xxD motif
MHTRCRNLGLRSAAALAAMILGLSAALGAPTKILPTTPPGITLVEEVKELLVSLPLFLWVRPGDAQGRTLFVFEKDVAGMSNCVAECADEFPPLRASPGAKAFGDWSLVRREDGGRQWAYQSHPLYTWVKEKTPGFVANSVGLAESADIEVGMLKQPGREALPVPLMPPAGWQVARFKPAASTVLPDGIGAGLVASAQAVALSNWKGLTLYTFDGNAKDDHQPCTASGCDQWLPVVAPLLASGVGEFSVVTRADGSRQWAYKKRPLYLYAGDKLPGDAYGIGIDKRWNLAALSEDFRPPNVTITALKGYGDVVSLKGMTLYGGYPFEERVGGRNLRATFLYNIYRKGKALAGDACGEDAQCLKMWHPFLAPTNAQPSGFWEPITRQDGTKQWCYKGYALYTYAGDRVPGDHNGQATYDFAKHEGNEGDLKRTAFLDDIIKGYYPAAGIYWNIAKP